MYVKLLLQWLETDLFGYLDSWERAVAERDGFSAAEKKSMLLSQETRTGLSGMYF